jgi:hypothetical protein
MKKLVLALVLTITALATVGSAWDVPLPPCYPDCEISR